MCRSDQTHSLMVPPYSWPSDGKLREVWKYLSQIHGMTVNILIHEWMMFIVNVGEYASPMDPLVYLLYMKMKTCYLIYIYYKHYISCTYTIYRLWYTNMAGWKINMLKMYFLSKNGRTLWCSSQIYKIHIYIHVLKPPERNGPFFTGLTCKSCWPYGQ